MKDVDVVEASHRRGVLVGQKITRLPVVGSMTGCDELVMRRLRRKWQHVARYMRTY